MLALLHHDAADSRVEVSNNGFASVSALSVACRPAGLAPEDAVAIVVQLSRTDLNAHGNPRFELLEIGIRRWVRALHRQAAKE